MRDRDARVSILSDFEDRIGGALEGVFAGVFRSPVQPVELARALGKAMDDGRVLGVGKVYAPLGYTVALSPEDDDNLGGFTSTLAGELATFLTDHARERGYHLVTAPHVTFTVHDDLRLGRFRVSAELAAPEESPVEVEPVAAVQDAEPVMGRFVDPVAAGMAVAAPPVMPAPRPEAAPRIASPLEETRTFEPGSEAGSVPGASVSLGEFGHDVLLTGDRVTVGRLSSSGIHIDDANVSREHAAFVRTPGGWAIQDLDSTNGTMLNGEPVGRADLRDGDVIEIGVSRLTFHRNGR